MNNTGLTDTLNKLKEQRHRAASEVAGLDKAIAALQGLTGSNGSFRWAGVKRVLSVAARRKISMAQKARWAKYRQQKTSKS